MAEPLNIQRRLRAAEGFQELGMFDDAVAEVETVLSESPDHLDALYRKGLIYLEQNKLAEAEPPFCRILEIDPEQAHVYVHLAWIHRRTLSVDKAVETIQRALQLKPSLPIAKYNLACYRAVQGRSEQALKLLQEAIKLDKTYRALARTDPDFGSVRETAEFRKLLES